MSQEISGPRRANLASAAKAAQLRHEVAVAQGYENWEQAVRASAWQPTNAWAARLGVSRSALRDWRHRYGVPSNRGLASWQGPADLSGSVKSLGPYADLASLDQAVRDSVGLSLVEASRLTHIHRDMISVRRKMLGLAGRGVRPAHGSVARTIDEREERVKSLGYRDWHDAVLATKDLPTGEAAQILGVLQRTVASVRRRARSNAVEGGLNAIAELNGQPNWSALMKVSMKTPAERLAEELGVQEIEILNWRGQAHGYRDWAHAVLSTASLDLDAASQDLETAGERIEFWRGRMQVNTTSLELADEAREIAEDLWSRGWSMTAVARVTEINQSLVGQLMRGEGPNRVKTGTTERLVALKTRKPPSRRVKAERTSPTATRMALTLLVENGMTQYAISKRTGQSYSWVSKVLRREAKTVTRAQREAVMSLLRQEMGHEVAEDLIRQNKALAARTSRAPASQQAD